MFGRAILSAVFATLSGITVFTTVVVPSTLRELTNDASLIVRGHITDVRVITGPERTVESVATVAVDRVIKGPATSFVSVWVPGGSVGRYRYLMVGAPTLRPNVMAVFFLARRADHQWRPIGLSAGVVPISSERASGRLVVHPPILAGRTVSPGPIVRGDPRRKALPVSEFESMVEMVIAGAEPANGARSPIGAAR
jgi:hypothetical protein